MKFSRDTIEADVEMCYYFPEDRHVREGSGTFPA